MWDALARCRLPSRGLLWSRGARLLFSSCLPAHISVQAVALLLFPSLFVNLSRLFLYKFFFFLSLSASEFSALKVIIWLHESFDSFFIIKPLPCLSPLYLHRFRISKVSFKSIPWDLDSLASIFILAVVVKNLLPMQEMQETWVQSLGCKDSLEKDVSTPSSILAWKIPWTEEPAGLQSMGSQRVGHDWAHTQEPRVQIKGFLEVQVVKNSSLAPSPPPLTFPRDWPPHTPASRRL